MKTTTITTTAPAGFAKLAKHYGLAPEYLASLVLSKFCEEPAGNLYIVSRQPDLTKAQSAVGDCSTASRVTLSNRETGVLRLTWRWRAGVLKSS